MRGNQGSQLTPEEVVSGWGRHVVADKRWLLHLSSFIIGQAEDFFDGVDQCSIGLDGQPVPAAVVKIGGNTFLAQPNAFLVLELNEAELYAKFVQNFASLSIQSVQQGADQGAHPEMIRMLLISSLRVQIAALETPETP